MAQEDLRLSDAHAANAVELGTLEGVGIADTVTASLVTLAADVAETIRLSDSATAAITLLADVTEVARLSDTAQAALALSTSVSESLRVADEGYTQYEQRETLRLTDALTAALSGNELTAAPGEALRLAETASTALTPLLVSLSETLRLADTPSAALQASGQLEAGPAEALRLSDSVSRALTPLLGSATEVLRLADTPTATRDGGAAPALPGVRIKVSVRVLTSSVANPTVITTATPHGIRTGAFVTFLDHAGATPGITGTYTATRINDTQFSINLPVTVGGTGGRVLAERDYEPDSLSWTSVVNARDTAEATIYDMTGEFRPELDAEVVIEEDGVERFRGFVDRAEEAGRTPAGAPIRVALTLADFNAFPERVLVTKTIPAGTLKSHLEALVPYLSAAPYSVTLHPSQADGPSINLQSHTFRKLSEVLDDLTTLSGGWLRDIDSSRRLRMTQPSISTPDAEFHITDGDERIEGDLKVIRSRDRYANRVWVRAGTGAEVNDRFETFLTGTGVDLGDFTYYTFTPAAISFIEQPTVITDNGVQKVIGAPGTTNSGVPWEWTWWWPTTGSGVAIRPAIVHNDAVYGNQSAGLTLSVWNKGMVYYNTFEDRWYGNGYSGPSDGYRWYWGGVVNARNRSLPPNIVYVNGTAYPVGTYGTTNEVLGTPWDWVWKDGDPPLLGHRQGASALVASDTISIFSLAPYELIVQAPTPASEPTSEQTQYGLWEELIEAPNVFSYDDAYALGNQWLQRRLVRPVGLRYTTLHGHLTPGLVQTIVAASRNVNGNYLIVEVTARTRERDYRVEREVALVDNATYINTWRDEFAQWVSGGQITGGQSTQLTISGGGGGGGGSTAMKVYVLSMREDGSVHSATPTWVPASNMQARIDTVERGSTAAVAYVRVRALDSGVSVTARIRNTTTGNIVGGPSAAVTSTSWTSVVIPVTLDAGVGYYELELLPSVADAPVTGIGWIE